MPAAQHMIGGGAYGPKRYCDNEIHGAEPDFCGRVQLLHLRRRAGHRSGQPGGTGHPGGGCPLWRERWGQAAGTEDKGRDKVIGCHDGQAHGVPAPGSGGPVACAQCDAGKEHGI